MTSAYACPGCQTAPADAAEAPDTPRALTLYLPDIHCAACISTAERALSAAPGVRSARVNLTQKRAAVEADPWVEPRDLIAALDHAGIEALEFDAAQADPADPAERAMLLRLGIAGFAMMNVMLLSVAVWAGATDATRDLLHWLAALIAVPSAAIAAQPFFRSALTALRARRLNMDVPISLAILLALGLSLYETSQSGEHAYFDAALALTFFLLVGRYLDLRVRGKARSAARELAALEVPRAIRIDGATRTEVRAASLAPGDLILVPPGARLAADGVVTDGRSEIDRSLLTGETAPVHVTPGTELAAGEVNLSGPLTLRVTAAGRDTRLARIADLVAAAESARSRYVALADRAARIYAPAVHLLALAAFAGWVWATGDVRHALNVAVATLIITCPCALGLAVPAVSAAASGRLYRQGVLIKSGTALERLAEADTAVFDKTGTLTEGRLRLREDLSDADLALAAGLAAGSSHPLARAVAAAAEARGVAPAEIGDIREHPGDGIEGWASTPPAEPHPSARARNGSAGPVAAVNTAPGADTGPTSGDDGARGARQGHGATVPLCSGASHPAPPDGIGASAGPDAAPRPRPAGPSVAAANGVEGDEWTGAEAHHALCSARTHTANATPGSGAAGGPDQGNTHADIRLVDADSDADRADAVPAPSTSSCCANGLRGATAAGQADARAGQPGLPARMAAWPRGACSGTTTGADAGPPQAAATPPTDVPSDHPPAFSGSTPPDHGQPAPLGAGAGPHPVGGILGDRAATGPALEPPPAAPGQPAARRRVRLGRPGWIGAPAPDRTATSLDRGDGTSVTLTFEDVPREGAAEAVAGLARLGLPAALVSGDAPAAARALAAEVGIGEVHAPERPEGKAARIRSLAADGRRVLMVGDGLNDTAALAEAHASIAPASALDAARVVADIVLTGRSLAPVPAIVATARAARSRMRENLGIAAAYNAVAIPLALAGHATPIMAALAMSASSICVSLNALRLR